MRVYFDSYSKWNGMKVAINSLADLSFFDRVIQDHNTGKIAFWNPRIRLSYGYDTQLRQAYFEIACPPNLTDEFIQKYVGDNERFGMERDCFAKFRRIGSDGSRIIRIRQSDFPNYCDSRIYTTVRNVYAL